MNNGDSVAYIWVNNEYQGYVPAGKARYTLSDGFVTGDSGFQADGSLKQTYSHGGWESSGDTINVLINMIDKKGKWYSTRIDTQGDTEHRAYVWFGEQKQGEEPDSLVWEDASQIENGGAPSFKKPYADADLEASTKGGLPSARFIAPFVGKYERTVTYDDGSIDQDFCNITADGNVRLWRETIPASFGKVSSFTVSKVLSQTELLVKSENGRESRLSKSGNSITFFGENYTKVR